MVLIFNAKCVEIAISHADLPTIKWLHKHADYQGVKLDIFKSKYTCSLEIMEYIVQEFNMCHNSFHDDDVRELRNYTREQFAFICAKFNLTGQLQYYLKIVCARDDLDLLQQHIGGINAELREICWKYACQYNSIRIVSWLSENMSVNDAPRLAKYFATACRNFALDVVIFLNTRCPQFLRDPKIRNIWQKIWWHHKHRHVLAYMLEQDRLYDIDNHDLITRMFATFPDIRRWLVDEYLDGDISGNQHLLFRLSFMTSLQIGEYFNNKHISICTISHDYEELTRHSQQPYLVRHRGLAESVGYIFNTGPIPGWHHVVVDDCGVASSDAPDMDVIQQFLCKSTPAIKSARAFQH